MRLIPVKEHAEENPEFIADPRCQESVYMSIDFYKRVGFDPPWICYYAYLDDQLVGCAGYKGKPIGGRVEIAYGTFEICRNQGIGTKICRELVELSLETDPSVIITARTLPENNYSTRILRKNGFLFSGVVLDPEDGEVWEWIYDRSPANT
jgi:[ribosomal protein S5]-alanine N-acetyltransferase